MVELHKTKEAFKKRAVLYARTSGDDRGNDGRNLASQIEMAREYAINKGYEVVAEIQEDDRGASGAAFELEGLNRVLEMAKDSTFDVLVPREIDRLSRSLAKQLIVEEELKRHSVEVEYVLGEYPDTPEGRLNKHIRATIAEYEREKVVERLARGKRNAVKAGSVMVGSNPPYGYRVEEDGKRRMLTIHEPEAKVVRLMYQWYVDGEGDNGPLSIYAIRSKLSDLGIPTHADIHGRYKKREHGKWNMSVVHAMLKSETYIGHWYYGKRNKANGKWRKNAKDSLVSIEVPAIVDLETWKAVQARLAENKQNSRRNLKHEYLVGRRVVCGHCGLKLGSSTLAPSRKVRYSYYRCQAVRRRREVARTCDLPTFRADQVDAGIWHWVKELLTDPEALALGLRKYQSEKKRENAPIRERLAVVDDLLADNRAQLERALDLYLAGNFPKEMLTDRQVRLEKTISGLEHERMGLISHLEADELSEGQIENLKEFVATVGAGIDVADADFATRRRVIEALDAWATLSVEDGQRVVRGLCVLGEKVFDLHSAQALL